jgi:hypothetical protein
VREEEKGNTNDGRKDKQKGWERNSKKWRKGYRGTKLIMEKSEV